MKILLSVIDEKPCNVEIPSIEEMDESMEHFKPKSPHFPPTTTKKLILLDLNGILILKSNKPFDFHKSIQVFKKVWYVIRNGCIQFLERLFECFHVGIWSSARYTNVDFVLKTIEKLAKKEFPFYIIRAQEESYIEVSHKIYRPDKPTVECIFKPLIAIWAHESREFNPSNTLLIDDSPFKGCVNPIENCIYLDSFDIEDKADILNNELLPYLLWLKNVSDVSDIIKLDRYGNDPIHKSHHQYEYFKEVILEWEAFNDGYIKHYLGGDAQSQIVSSTSSSHFACDSKKHQSDIRQQELSYELKKYQSDIRQQELPYESKKDQSDMQQQELHVVSSSLDFSKVEILKKIKRPETLNDMQACFYAIKLGYIRSYIT